MFKIKDIMDKDNVPRCQDGITCNKLAAPPLILSTFAEVKNNDFISRVLKFLRLRKDNIEIKELAVCYNCYAERKKQLVAKQVK